jgi:hypothetical protein
MDLKGKIYCTMGTVLLKNRTQSNCLKKVLRLFLEDLYSTADN